MLIRNGSGVIFDYAMYKLLSYSWGSSRNKKETRYMDSLIFQYISNSLGLIAVISEFLQNIPFSANKLLECDMKLV